MRIVAASLMRATASCATGANMHYVATSGVQRAILTVGSGLVSLLDPRRDDMISAFGELTAGATLPRLLETMRRDAEGARILAERPTISTRTLPPLDELAASAPGSLGHAYAHFMQRNGITSDSRKPVLFVHDDELAYVMRRYRETHDFTHLLLDMNTNMLGEVSVKVFEAVQLGLPMCWLAGLFGMLRLGPRHTERYLSTHLPWVIEQAERATKPFVNVYFERRLAMPIDELRRELNITTLTKYSH